MKNCIQCDFLLEVDKKFCAECGAKQPEIKSNVTNDNSSPIIGDKNVMSGVNFGKTEEYKITGNTTINKIEDDTKRIINCAVSGKRILFGESILCPTCTKEVSQDSFNRESVRCFNCDNNALEIYRREFQKVLLDGIVDSSERLELDRLAVSLLIDDIKRIETENEEKFKKINSKENSTLSGFHKIEFERASQQIFENNNLEIGLQKLKGIFSKNSTNDEVANLYFMIEALHAPTAYIQEYSNRRIDIYWQHYWAFLSYLKTNQINEAFDAIESNKTLFADKTNDILLAEVAFYLYCFITDKNNGYLDEAKEQYVSFGKNVKGPLLPLVKVVDLIINHTGEDYFDLIQDTDKVESFILSHIFGLHKGHQNNVTEESNVDSTSPADNLNKIISFSENHTQNSEEIQIQKKAVEFTSDEEIWLDKDLGLLIKQNKLFFIDSRDNKQYPTFFTDSTIWLGRNLSYFNGNFSVDNSNPTDSCVYNNLPSDNQLIVPKGWYMPTMDDWDRLCNFIAIKSGLEHLDDYQSYLSSIHPKIPIVKNFGINYKYAHFYIFDNTPDSFIVSKNSENYFMDGENELAVRIYIPLNKSIINKLKELNFLLPDYINYEDIRIIEETKSNIDINDLNIGSSVSCINNKNEDRSIISELENGSLYTISEINVRKNIITLQEYPQQNNSEKKKWFNISLFNLEVNNNSEKKIEAKVTIQKTVIETPKSNQNVIKTNLDEINKTIEMGSLQWSTSFLKTATFKSGKKIPIIDDANEWLAACREGKPAMCYYLNNPNNHALYNYYAISSLEGLAPEGFKIPGDDEGIADIDLNFLLNFSLPKGIRKVGTNTQTGKYYNDLFSDELMCGTIMDISHFFECYDFPDCLGTYVIEWNSSYVGINNYNGFWGLPVLLIKKNDSKLVNNLDEDYSDLYNVILENSGINKLGVIQVVKEITGLGLKETKDLVDGAPSVVKCDIYKEEAEAIKKAIEEAGGVVVLSNTKKLETKDKKEDEESVKEENVKFTEENHLKKEQTKNPVADFKEVKIGEQEWATKNLNLINFRNGEPLFHAKSQDEWFKAFNEKKPAWCFYNFDEIEGESYDIIYNYYAVIDKRNIAPENWHIPGEDEWNDLINYIGKSNNKDIISKKNGGVNKYNFKGRFNGHINYEDEFEFNDNSFQAWTSTNNERVGCVFVVNETVLHTYISDAYEGSSIRLLKGNGKTEKKVSIGVKEIVNLPSITIGNQVWTNENLNVDKFSNGDYIEQANNANDFKSEKPLWAYVNFDPKTEKIYGKVYNHYAVLDSRGLAPKGWKIPKKSDWLELATFLGGEKIAGKKLKNTSGWDNFGSSLFGKGKSNGNGTNENGFSAMPNGIASIVGFNYVGGEANFRCQDFGADSYKSAYSVQLKNYSDELFYTQSQNKEALSIRLLKD